jgi:hypothetical protein
MDNEEASFEEVWLRHKVPKASMSAFDATEVGTLRVARDHATFETSTGSSQIANISAIKYGRVGSDFVNRWIRIEYYDKDQYRQVFLKDGGWRGWRSILTRSNAPILAALSRATLQS